MVTSRLPTLSVRRYLTQKTRHNRRDYLVYTSKLSLRRVGDLGTAKKSVERRNVSRHVSAALISRRDLPGTLTGLPQQVPQRGDFRRRALPARLDCIFRINLALSTLNQRVQGSSPCAPTKFSQTFESFVGRSQRRSGCLVFLNC